MAERSARQLDPLERTLHGQVADSIEPCDDTHSPWRYFLSPSAAARGLFRHVTASSNYRRLAAENSIRKLTYGKA
jgi:hypothetical protein